LIKDSQVSFRKIAKELGTSTDTIMRRYRRLEKEKVIQPVITVNPLKLGYEAFVYFVIKVSSLKSLREVTEQVSKIPDVLAVMETVGEFDLTIIAMVKNITHTYKIGEDIANVSGVRRVSIDQIAMDQLLRGRTLPPTPWHNLFLKGENANP